MKGKWRTRPSDVLVKDLYCFFLLLLMLVWGGYKVSEACILEHTEREFGVELDYSSSVPHFFLIGLNTEGEGFLIGLVKRWKGDTVYEYHYESDSKRTVCFNCGSGRELL